MRRLLSLLLALLLLSGCAVKTPDPTDTSSGTTVPLTTPNQPSLYDPDNPVEAETAGAVRAYSLGTVDCMGIAAMGEDILLFTTEPGIYLTRINGDSGAVTAKVSLNGDISLDSGAFQVTDKRICYYDSSTGNVVFLDSQLSETSRVPLPEGIAGDPVLPPDMGTIYYSIGQEIRAIDMQTGISRLVMRNSAASQILLQNCFDGQILTSLVTEASGDSYICFVSAQDGEILDKDAAILDFAPYEDTYFLQRTNGIITERLFGTIDGEIQSLNLTGEIDAIPALAMGGILTISGQDVLELCFYDLSTGRKTAMITLSDVEAPYAYAVGQEAIWLLSYDEASKQSVLYRWDILKSPVEDDTVYTGPRYTAESPDLEGLAACQSLASQIGKTYSVDIRIGTAAVEPPCDYELEPEYQAAAFQEGLQAFEQVLARYPEGFFDAICQGTSSGVLHICLVRSISENLPGVQFWSHGDAYIALAIGESMEQTFYHTLSYVLDAYIIANSLAYDNWEDLNPAGFTYDYSYDSYMEREGQDYLEGDTRAFIDSFATTYPKEDRARILEYAMLDNQAELFQPEILQKKLRQICIGIRDAFHWKKDPRTFPWEQYLEDPLAYIAN